MSVINKHQIDRWLQCNSVSCARLLNIGLNAEIYFPVLKMCDPDYLYVTDLIFRHSRLSEILSCDKLCRINGFWLYHQIPNQVTYINHRYRLMEQLALSRNTFHTIPSTGPTPSIRHHYTIYIIKHGHQHITGRAMPQIRSHPNLCITSSINQSRFWHFMVFGTNQAELRSCFLIDLHVDRLLFYTCYIRIPSLPYFSIHLSETRPLPWEVQLDLVGDIEHKLIHRQFPGRFLLTRLALG